MPDTGFYPDLGWASDPENKAWLAGLRGGGSRGGQHPGPGGGFATFGGGLNTLIGGSSLGAPAWMRRTPYETQALDPMTMLRQSASAVPGRDPMSGLRQTAGAQPMVSGRAWGGGGGSGNTMMGLWQNWRAANATGAGTGTAADNNGNQPLTWQQALANNDPGWAGTFWRTLAPYGLGGTFGPTGSADVAAAIEAQGNRLAGGAYNRAQKQAQVLNLDPAAAASYAMEAGLRGQTDTANAMQSAQLQQMMAAQDWARNILGAYLGANTAAGATDSIHRYGIDAQGGGSGWGQLLGGLGGSVLGGWLSPGGWWGGR